MSKQQQHQQHEQQKNESLQRGFFISGDIQDVLNDEVVRLKKSQTTFFSTDIMSFVLVMLVVLGIPAGTFLWVAWAFTSMLGV